jgi:hypothetical protein
MNPPLAEQLKSSATPRLFIGDVCRERQSNFRTRSGFAPKFQSSSDSTRAFVNTGHSPVAWAATIFEYLSVDAASIVTYKHAENVRVITDLSFDPMRVGMMKGISQQFSGHTNDLLLDQPS